MPPSATLAERLARLAYDLRVISALAALLVKSVKADLAAAELIAATMRNLRPPDLLPVLLEASKILVDADGNETMERVKLLDRYRCSSTTPANSTEPSTFPNGRYASPRS